MIDEIRKRHNSKSVTKRFVVTDGPQVHKDIQELLTEIDWLRKIIKNGKVVNDENKTM